MQQGILRLWADAFGLEIPGDAEGISAAQLILSNAQNSGAAILLDNLDHVLRCNEENFYWMEQVLVAPLLTQAGCAIVAASNVPIQGQWRDFETRPRCHTMHLQPFTQQDVASLLQLTSPESNAYA